MAKSTAKSTMTNKRASGTMQKAAPERSAAPDRNGTAMLGEELGELQRDLIYQALETELGGLDIYRTALECAQNEDLREEWQEYLEHTEHHVEVMRELCTELGLDPEEDTPGRRVVHHIGSSLVQAMEMARKDAPPAAAELVACECVTLAETKDHANWSLMGALAKSSSGELKRALAKAVAEVENEEDEHLYHSAGWGRELWKQGLELEATLPPPEERQNVRSAIGAARAKESSARNTRSASQARKVEPARASRKSKTAKSAR